MFKAVKVRIYPIKAQQVHLAQAFGCVRWVWNRSLATITAIPGKLGVVKAKVHRDINGKVKTVTVSENPDGRYLASMLVDDGVECPSPGSEGDDIGIDIGLSPLLTKA